MSVLSKLASSLNRRDEEANKELGRELVRTKNLAGIQEIGENLWNRDKKIQSDCEAVMEEIGRNAPELIEDFVYDFLKLLSSKNNHRVWQSMINLSLIAERKPDEIFEKRETIFEAIKKGSVITQDNGIKTLAKVASADDKYNKVLFPYLIEQLKTCRPKSVPQYAESIFMAVKAENREEYLSLLKQRVGTLSASQQSRVKKIMRQPNLD